MVKKLLITLLKVAISAAIMGYLIYDAVWGQKTATCSPTLSTSQSDGTCWPPPGCPARWPCC